MQFEAKVIEDSISTSGVRLATLQLCYPRFIHAEFMTHRAFSRNASSSRAIPVAKMIEQVRTNPAMPVHWGQNQPGMQAREELSDEMNAGLGTSPRQYAKNLWMHAANQAADVAESMMRIGAHKQVANRILEPFQWMHVIVTATEWDNFFELRDHEDAEPNIQHLARLMKRAMDESEPARRLEYVDQVWNWHLPYVTREEREQAMAHGGPLLLAKLSAARCARVSYLNHDGSTPNMDKDIALFDMLVGSRPLHASPVEHQAYPMNHLPMNNFSGNFRGWHQYRKSVEAELE